MRSGAESEGKNHFRKAPSQRSSQKYSQTKRRRLRRGDSASKRRRSLPLMVPFAGALSISLADQDFFMAAYRPVSTTVSEHSRFKIQGSPSLQPALPDMDRKGKLILLKKSGFDSSVGGSRLRILQLRQCLYFFCCDPWAPVTPGFSLWSVDKNLETCWQRCHNAEPTHHPGERRRRRIEAWPRLFALRPSFKCLIKG